MIRHIKHRFLFSHSPQIVWKYLTESELMEQWLMKNDFQPIVGRDFQFSTNPIASLDFDGIFYCKVLEVIPIKKLCYSWRSGPGEGEITLDSVVTWKLKPNDKGTELLLEHSGFAKKENLNFYNGLMHGWKEKLHGIGQLLEAFQHETTKA